MSEAKIVLTAEDKTRAAFESAKQGLHGINSAATAVGLSFTALGTAATLGGLTAMVRSVANSLDAFNDLKDATGASIENISALEDVARRTGANFDTVSTSLVKFNQALGQTAKPGSDAEKVLAAIGLNAKQLRDLDPAEALHRTAVALSQFADDGNKARAVQELFGKSLREVAPFLKDLAEQGQLNATVTTKQAEEAEKFNKELFKLSATMQDVSRDIAGPLIGGMNGLIEKFREGKREGEGLIVTLLRQTEIARLLGMNKPGGSSPRPEGTWDAPPAAPSTTSINLPPQADPKAVAAAKAAAAASLKEAHRVAEERQKLRNQEYEQIEKFLAKEKELEKKAGDDLIQLQQKIFAAYEESEQKAFASIIAKTDAVKAEIDGNGKLRSKVESLTLARLEDMKVAMAAGGEDLESINARIQAQQTLIGLYQNREVQEANTKAAEAAQREWAQVGQALTDSLMRGGRSAAQYLKDLFRTLVLRPMLAPVGQAMGQVLGGGGSTTAMGAMGGMGGGGFNMNNMGLVGAGFQALTGASVGASAASLGVANTVGALGGDALGALITTNGGWAGVGTAASAAGGAMAAIGAAMPYVAIVLAIASMFIKDRGGPKAESGFGFGVRRGQGDSGAAQAQVEAIENLYRDSLRVLGGTDRGFQAGVFSSQDPKGTAQTQLDVIGSMGGQAFYTRTGENVGRSEEELKAEMAQAVSRVLLGALQRSDVPGMLGEWVESLGNVAMMSAKQVEQALARLQKAGGEKKALDDVWFDLTATAAEKTRRMRERELEALDLTNRAQAVRIHSLQDEIAKQQLAREVYAQASSELAELRLNLGGYVDRLNATPAGLLAPESQLANAKAQFAIQLASAKAGNRNAMQGITGYADQLIAAQVGYTANGTETGDTIGYVKQALTELPDLLSAEQIVAQSVQDGTTLLNASMQDLIARADANAAAQIAAINAQGQAEIATTLAQASANEQAQVQALIEQATAPMTGNLFQRVRSRAAALGQLHTLGVEGYADGGDYSGGFVHMVGERGPELRASGPARYWSTEQTARMVGGGDPELRAKVDRLTATVEQLLQQLVLVSADGARRQIGALEEIADNTGRSATGHLLARTQVPERKVAA